MDENDLKFLISSYQTKCSDLLSQVVASDAKVIKLQQIVEVLTNQVNELNKKVVELTTVEEENTDFSEAEIQPATPPKTTSKRTSKSS